MAKIPQTLNDIVWMADDIFQALCALILCVTILIVLLGGAVVVSFIVIRAVAAIIA